MDAMRAGDLPPDDVHACVHAAAAAATCLHDDDERARRAPVRVIGCYAPSAVHRPHHRHGAPRSG
eukprot:5514094-Ditylum_brightwellii.AAC.1